MSSKLISGKNVNVFQVDGGDKPIICSKSCTITKTFEVIEKTSIASIAREFTTGMYEWEITIDGALTVDVVTAGQKTLFDFFDGTVKNMKVVFTDGTTTKTATGAAITPDLSITADVSDAASYSLTFKGTGVLTIA